jgi:capsular polysaccharide biosynthesis protein
VTDDWSYGYFHWLCDALPRLFTIREQLRELVLLLPHRYESLEYVRSSLEIFGARRVEYVRDGEVCVCERLVMPTHAAPSGNYNEGLMREMRRFMLDSFGAGDEPRERIYLSRSRAPKRKVRNEDEVVAVLGEFGFRVVHFEDYAFARQVEIAAGASHFVSNHGAGLTNTLFMRPGGSVLELRRRDERERNWFFNLANAAGLEYFYQNCAPADADEDPHTADLLVDARALRENLSLMFGGGAGTL